MPITAAPLELVRVSPAACGLLSAIHATCFDEAWSERMIASLLHSPGGVGLLARLGEAPVGLALLRTAADEAELLTIGVAPGARRVGVGRALLARISAEAAAAGVKTLFLDVAVSNAGARTLYEEAGFSEVGRRAAYYRSGDDALVLALVLESGLRSTP